MKLSHGDKQAHRYPKPGLVSEGLWAEEECPDNLQTGCFKTDPGAGMATVWTSEKMVEMWQVLTPAPAAVPAATGAVELENATDVVRVSTFVTTVLIT